MAKKEWKALLDKANKDLKQYGARLNVSREDNTYTLDVVWTGKLNYAEDYACGYYEEEMAELINEAWAHVRAKANRKKPVIVNTRYGNFRLEDDGETLDAVCTTQDSFRFVFGHGTSIADIKADIEREHEEVYEQGDVEPERDDVPQFTIAKPEDVGRFFHWLVFERRVNFHPDDDFKDYVALEGGGRTFTDPQAERLNKVMEQCFEVCERYQRDIYEIAIRTMGLFHYCDKNDTLANFCKNYNPDAPKPEYTRKQMENAVMLAADLWQRMYNRTDCVDGGAIEVAGVIIEEACEMEEWINEKYGPDDEEYLDRVEEYEAIVAERYGLEKETTN